MPTTISALDLVDVVYLMTILADHPRSIDRYIDYFGSGGGPRSRGAEPGTDSATKAVSPPYAMSPKALHPTKGFLTSEGRGWRVKTITATDLLGTYRDVVARLQHEATVLTADAASSNFVDLAQSVEHQELARLTATRLAERARRLQIALTRMADGEYGVCSECGTSIPPKRHLAVPDATTCVACQERLEQARA